MLDGVWWKLRQATLAAWGQTWLRLHCPFQRWPFKLARMFDERVEWNVRCAPASRPEDAADADDGEDDNELSEAEEEWRHATARREAAEVLKGGDVKETDGFVYQNRKVLGRIWDLPCGRDAEVVAVFCNRHANCNCNVALKGSMTRAKLHLWLRSQHVYNNTTSHLEDFVCLWMLC